MTTAYRVPELQHALNLVEVSALVLVPQLATSNYVDMIKSLCPEVRARDAIGSLHR